MVLLKNLLYKVTRGVPLQDSTKVSVRLPLIRVSRRMWLLGSRVSGLGAAGFLGLGLLVEYPKGK